MQTDFDQVIEANKNLIYKIASGFYGAEMEDLYQVGAIGVMKAYRKYKEDSNAKFSTYAHDYIFGEMYQFVNHNKSIKLNRDCLRLYKKLVQTKYALAQRLGKMPTVDEIALYLELEPELVASTMNAGASILSLDADNKEEDHYTLYDQMKDNSADRVEAHLVVEECLNTLQSPEKDIIECRYFKDYTQHETAKVLGLTQAMVSRYEKKGIERMRSFISR